MPADRFMLSFEPSASSPEADAGIQLPTLVRIDGASKVMVPFDTTPQSDSSLLLTPREAQPPGAKFELDADAPTCDAQRALHAAFTLTAPAPTPQSDLGTLSWQRMRSTTMVTDLGGACSAEVDASYADLTLALAAPLQPLASLLRYELIVDEAVNPGFSTGLGARTRQGTDPLRVYANCNPDPHFKGDGDVTPAKHQVALRATLPDGTRFSTPTIEVDLSCTGQTTSAASLPDASTLIDNELHKGEGCALASSASSSTFVLAALALLLRRRRHA